MAVTMADYTIVTVYTYDDEEYDETRIDATAVREDGSYANYYANGCVEVYELDGLVVMVCDDGTTETYEDGYVFWYNDEGSYREIATDGYVYGYDAESGSNYTVYPDGTT